MNNKESILESRIEMAIRIYAVCQALGISVSTQQAAELASSLEAMGYRKFEIVEEDV